MSVTSWYWRFPERSSNKKQSRNGRTCNGKRERNANQGGTERRKGKNGVAEDLKSNEEIIRFKKKS